MAYSLPAHSRTKLSQYSASWAVVRMVGVVTLFSIVLNHTFAASIPYAAGFSGQFGAFGRDCLITRALLIG